jgi:hypothetical protein
MQNVILSSSTTLQIYATVRKQPVPMHASCDQWECGTLSWAHPWCCRQTYSMARRQPIAREYSILRFSSDQWEWGTSTWAHPRCWCIRHSPGTTNSMTVYYSYYSIDQWEWGITLSSSLMLQMVATAQKQPIAWQYTIERPMGMRHLSLSSSLMLQTVATARKQPIAWEYCTSCDQWEWGTLSWAHPSWCCCRRSPQPGNNQ